MDSEDNILLRDRDVLVIPTLEDKIYVNGGVYRPGAFDYQANLCVMDYVGLAGGATPRGNLKKTMVLRPGRALRPFTTAMSPLVLAKPC